MNEWRLAAMKTKYLFIILALLCLTLCGCAETNTVSIAEGGPLVYMTTYGERNPGGGTALAFAYAVDERTGVVYIVGDAHYRGYMSVALNADGTPVTEDQLKGWGKHEDSD